MLSVRRIRLILRVELVRRYRRKRAERLGSVGIFLEAFGWAFAAVFCGLVAYGVGRYVDVHSTSFLVGTRQVLVVLWMLVVAFVCVWTVRTPGVFQLDTVLAPAVPTADAAVGLFLSRATLPLLSVFVPVVCGAIGLGLGTRSLLIVPTATVSVLLLVTSSALFALLVGGAVRVLVRRYVRPRINPIAIFGAGLAIPLVLIASGTSETVVAHSSVLATTSPIGWYADLALLPHGGAYWRAGFVTGGTLAFVPVFGLCLIRLCARSTVTDDPPPGTATRTAMPKPTPTHLGSRSLATFSSAGPLVTVLSAKWVRAIRSPLKMWYVLYPLLGLYFPVRTIVETGAVPSYLPLLVVFYGSWATGGVLSLNALGDEQSVLPVTLLSVPSRRLLVWGNVLAGCLLGLPLFVSLVILTGILTATGLAQLVVYTLLCIGFGVMASTVATACGLLFPTFERSRVTRNTTALVPSSTAVLLYGFVYLLITVPILVAFTPSLREVSVDVTGVSAPDVVAFAVGYSGLVAVIATVASVLYSIHHLENYTL